MGKISVVIVFLAAGFTLLCFWPAVSPKADDTVVTADNQVVRDEGYGNEDVEYYNSEDDVKNVEEPVGNDAKY